MTISKERHQAIMVRDALHRIIAKLSQGKTTLPSELSYFVGKSECKTTALFHWMACTAVAEKYQQVGKSDIATIMLQMCSTIEQAYLSNDLSFSRRDEIHAAAEGLRAYYHGIKRISIHQRQFKCDDLDVMLCDFGTKRGITHWVCLQKDLRFRWSDNGVIRLNYLARCWDSYASKEVTWEDRMIGFSDFPTYPEYCGQVF